MIFKSSGLKKVIIHYSIKYFLNIQKTKGVENADFCGGTRESLRERIQI